MLHPEVSSSPFTLPTASIGPIHYKTNLGGSFEGSLALGISAVAKISFLRFPLWGIHLVHFRVVESARETLIELYIMWQQRRSHAVVCGEGIRGVMEIRTTPNAIPGFPVHSHCSISAFAGFARGLDSERKV